MVLAGCAALALAGCSANTARATSDAASAGEISAAAVKHTLAEAAAQAAVARPGAKVCRQLRLGIAELDWIRGTVVEVAGGRVGVRIDDPGRFSHILHGTSVERGTLIWDAPIAWTPCV